MKIAVIIFVYNRPDMITKMLHSLKKCEGLSEHDLYVFADGPKTDGDREKVEQARQLVKDFIVSQKSDNTKMICRDRNIGLAKSVITGVSEIINLYDAVICIEDDLVFSRDFLRYMDGALEKFKNDNEIWSIAGYCQDLKGLRDFDKNSFLSYRASSWGWGTWADRWNQIDWDVKDYMQFKKDYRKRKEFSRGGKDLPILLDYQMCGLIDSWAIRWCYSQYKHKQYSVFPAETRVTHIGCNKESTHVKKQFGKNQVMKEEHPITDKYDAVLSEQLLKDFHDYYRMSYVKASIKIFLFTKFGINLNKLLKK
jgi:glycosyltransferase involved in cell wall biosynthesis